MNLPLPILALLGAPCMRGVVALSSRVRWLVLTVGPVYLLGFVLDRTVVSVLFS